MNGRIFVVFLWLTTVSGCQGPPVQQMDVAAVLDVAMTLGRDSETLEIATAEVEVSAPDMAPVRVALAVQGDRVSGSVGVPIGSDREVVIRLADATGDVICAGSETIDIVDGLNEISGVLLCSPDGSQGHLLIDVELTTVEILASASPAVVPLDGEATLAVSIEPDIDVEILWDASAGTINSPQSRQTLWWPDGVGADIDVLVSVRLSTDAGLAISRQLVLKTVAAAQTIGDILMAPASLAASRSSSQYGIDVVAGVPAPRRVRQSENYRIHLLWGSHMELQ